MAPPTMPLRSLVPCLLLAMTVTGHAEDLASALKRFESLKSRSQGIRATSTRDEVRNLLGEPFHKHQGMWSPMETDVETWHYLSFTDDERHLRFAVRFDSKIQAGCGVVAKDVKREEVRKSEKLTVKGVVEQVNPDYPEKGSEGFLCHVKIQDGSRFSFAVANRNRVTGQPLEGARVEVIYHGTPGERDYIFIGERSLALDSMVFSTP